MNIERKLPFSVSGWIDPFLICATIATTYYTASSFDTSDTTLSIVILVSVIAVMSSVEWIRRPKNTHTNIKQMSHRSAIAWIGTMAGLLIVFIGWILIAEYQNTYYSPFLTTLPLILIIAPVASALCIFATERMLGPTESGGYQLGLLVLGRTKQINWAELRHYFLMWFLRGFFLPINFCELVYAIGMFRGKIHTLFNGPFIQIEYYLLAAIYAFIIAAIVPGYLFGSRLLRTSTTAVSTSWRGWVLTLICYTPFEVAVFGAWFKYQSSIPIYPWNQPWTIALSSFPIALACMGAVLLAFAIIHLWGEAQLGLRSSHLSNRGIITTGPYRFCRHPVFLSKCISWFLIWLPFMASANILDSARLTLGWILVCAVYFLRCIAEEKLLSSDPAYRSYALWMDDNGIFSMFSKRFPVLTYEWRLRRWIKTGEVTLKA